MKKVISILLVAVLLLSAMPLTAMASEPPYSLSFESVDAMLEGINDYSQEFPNVSYQDMAIERPKDCVLTQKQVALPVLISDYATEYEYSIAESRFGMGVDYTFTSFKTVESDTYIRFLTYYNVPKQLINSKLERIYYDNPRVESKYFHSGEVDGVKYRAVQIEKDGAVRSEYRFAYADKYIVCYTDEEFSQQLLDSLSFEKTDAKLSLYMSDEKYFDRIMAEFNSRIGEAGYDEQYFHFSDESNEEPDWALILCQIMPPPWEMPFGVRVGERVLYTVGGCSYTPVGYCVYISETDRVIELSNENMAEIYALCPGFEQIIEENELGRTFGDVDNNGQLDILDATMIQRFLAGYSYDPSKYQVEYEIQHAFCLISDVDHDDEITVLDATTIQRKLADLE